MKRSSAALGAKAAAPSRVSGTWDFKWVPGTEIQVAIQQPLPDMDVDIKKASERLAGALAAWLPGGSGRRPNLSYRILPDYLPPPVSKNIARSDPAKLAARPFLEQDVLVSFAPLPVTIPATSEHNKSEVNFPRSELGTYTRRKEYGVPTIYLGVHAGFKKGEDGLEWLDSAEGRFTLIHEVGHVLGMAHEQQNPRLPKGSLVWRDIEQMRKIAQQRNSRTPPDAELDAFIHGEIIDPWPDGYSDWREPPKVGPRNTIDFDSVMAKPVYRCFLAGNHGGELDCSRLDCCSIEQSEFRRLAKPTQSDLEQLVVMYGPAPA